MTMLTMLLLVGCSGRHVRKESRFARIHDEQLKERNRMLSELVDDVMKPCVWEGEVGDYALFAVSASAHGRVHVDATFFRSSETRKRCLLAAAAHEKLPSWEGPTVGAVWVIGTKQHLPSWIPTALPPAWRERLASKAVALAASARDPHASCADTCLPHAPTESATLRVFLFPEGQVATVTPLAVDASGASAELLDCVRGLFRSWNFEPVASEGFFWSDVKVTRACRPRE